LILTYFACEAVLQEGNKNLDYDVILSTPEKRLDELVHLAELCIEVHQQNEEYHSEVTGKSFYVSKFIVLGSRSFPVVPGGNARS
jgi:hypothetical protein